MDIKELFDKYIKPNDLLGHTRKQFTKDVQELLNKEMPSESEAKSFLRKHHSSEDVRFGGMEMFYWFKSQLSKGESDWVCKDCNGIWFGENITCTCGHGIYTDKGDGGKYKKLIYIPIIGLIIGIVLSLKKNNALRLSGREAMFMMIIHLFVPEAVALIIIIITR